VIEQRLGVLEREDEEPPRQRAIAQGADLIWDTLSEDDRKAYGIALGSIPDPA
jgi:hypothetical protein